MQKLFLNICFKFFYDRIIDFDNLFRNSLTWRDVQHLIVRSSRNDIIDKSVKWTVNKAGIRGTVFLLLWFFNN